MKILKKIKNKLSRINKPKGKQEAFFTKDIFEDKKFIIGDYTYGKPTILFENNNTNLCIGKYCSIAENVTIFLGGNHRIDWITTYPFNVLSKYFPEAEGIKGHPATKGDVIIGNDVWLGRNVVILSGISIGDGAVIAAGAVLTKNVGPYEIWAGNPAKMIKKRFDVADINFLLKLKWWDQDINDVKKEINMLCSSNIKNYINKKIKFEKDFH